MGCTLYPARSPAGYTLHPRSPGPRIRKQAMGKGWSPTVGLVLLHEVISLNSSSLEALCIELRASIYIQIVALLAYSCTLIGLSVGNADRSNAPPPHRYFSGRVTWRRTGGILKCTTHGPPTINSHPVRAPVYPLARTCGRPWPLGSPPAWSPP